MPKVPVQEIFSRGLVTSRPPHMLSSGELVRAGHTVYRENNPCLLRAPDHGYYSSDDLQTVFPNSSVAGLFSANFEAEESPDQIIAKVGRDYVISPITGFDGNTFEPITSPAKITGTLGTIPETANVVFSNSTATVACPSAGAWNTLAVIGRCVASRTACPPQENYVIIGVNYSGANVSSIVLNAKPKVSTTELMWFAPEFTMANDDYVFYSSSVGFSGQIVNESLTVQSGAVASSHVGGANPKYITPSATWPTSVYNPYVCIGRKIRLGTATNSPTAFIDYFTMNNGNVQYVYSSNFTFTNTANVDVVFENNVINVVLTAVGGTPDAGQIPGYKKCYFNFYAAPGAYEIALLGGVGRTLTDATTAIDGLSWDGTAFVWDGKTVPHRLSYYPRKHFHHSFDTTPSVVYRPVGLNPVVTAPLVVAESTGNTASWNAFLGAGYYWFLITESYSPEGSFNPSESNYTITKDPVESAYTAKGTSTTVSDSNQNLTIGRPVLVDVSSLNHYVKITCPAPVNNGEEGFLSSHWNVYMAKGITVGQSQDVNPPPLTNFHRVLTVPIVRRTAGQIIELRDKVEKITARIKDISEVTGRAYFRLQKWVKHSPYYTLQGRSGASIAESLRSPMMDFSLSNADLTPLGTGPTAGLKVYGIEVTLYPCIGAQYSINAFGAAIDSTTTEAQFFTEFRTRSQAGYPVMKTTKKTDAGDSAVVIGGPGELWGLDPDTLDIGTLKLRLNLQWSNGQKKWGFRCKLKDTQTNTWNGVNYGFTDTPNSPEFYVAEPGLIPVPGRAVGDNSSPKVYNVVPDITVNLHFTGTTINLNGPLYKVVTYSESASGVSISDPVMLRPPIASIGDAFQGSLVLNDVSAPSFIRYSMPDRPEYFPAPYRMRMGTKRRGPITALKTFKGVLIVGMERAIKRVNYLPKEDSTDFLNQVGIAHEDISTSHGIVGPNAVSEFDLPGVGSVLAYVSTVGLRMTDGSSTRALNTDVNLKDYVHPEHWGKCVLKTYPNQKWLVLYYVPKEADHGQLTRSFYFSFSEDHLKSPMTLELVNQPGLTGPLSATGPNDCFVVDSTECIINSSPCIVTTDGQYIYVEDSKVSSTPVKTAAANDDPTLVNRVNAPDIKSRDIFPAGPTQDANVGAIYILHETKGSHFIRTDGTSTKGSTTLSFTSPVNAHTPVVGERVIHGGWDNVVTVLQVVDNYNIIVSAPAVRSVTTDAVYDTGNIMVRINAGQLGEDMVPIVTEYRSTTVGVNQTFLMDGTANRFSVEISKVENPNTGALMDLNEEMSIAGISYHVMSAGDAGLHVN